KSCASRPEGLIAIRLLPSPPPGPRSIASCPSSKALTAIPSGESGATNSSTSDARSVSAQPRLSGNTCDGGLAEFANETSRLPCLRCVHYGPDQGPLRLA